MAGPNFITRPAWLTRQEQRIYRLESLTLGPQPAATLRAATVGARPVLTSDVWYEEPLGSEWVAAYRLSFQDRQTFVIGELRIFPAAAPREASTGRWLGDVLGSDARRRSLYPTELRGRALIVRNSQRPNRLVFQLPARIPDRLGVDLLGLVAWDMGVSTAGPNRPSRPTASTALSETAARSGRPIHGVRLQAGAPAASQPPRSLRWPVRRPRSAPAGRAGRHLDGSQGRQCRIPGRRFP